jgi:hypothetical protein
MSTTEAPSPATAPATETPAAEGQPMVKDRVYTGAVVEGFNPTLGRVVSLKDGQLVFTPRGTNYELHLKADGLDAPIGKPTRGVVRVQARKVYTVPTGGAFIAPIMGQPRIVQGMVTHVLESGPNRQVVVKAGAHVVVDLPKDDHAIDLNDGAIEAGGMINVVCAPGAWFEPSP